LLVFIDKGVKINAKYYEKDVFKKHLLAEETCMETTIFASSKTEPNIEVVQKKIPRFYSQRYVATRLTGFENTGFLHLGLHAGTTEKCNKVALNWFYNFKSIGSKSGSHM
jgi:hypothetical protein